MSTEHIGSFPFLCMKVAHYAVGSRHVIGLCKIVNVNKFSRLDKRTLVNSDFKVVNACELVYLAHYGIFLVCVYKHTYTDNFFISVNFRSVHVPRSTVAKSNFNRISTFTTVYFANVYKVQPYVRHIKNLTFLFLFVILYKLLLYFTKHFVVSQ